MNKEVGKYFMVSGLILLIAAVIFGALGGILYLFPQDLRDILPFIHLRPMHVSSVIFWIFFTATGGLYLYLPENRKTSVTGKIHFFLLLTAAAGGIICYASGIFGGREYWEFPPLLAIPVAGGFMFFLFNYIDTIRKEKKPWPVYYWMWLTGIIFFLISFTESYLWMLPWFGENLVRDMAIQWKSYGSMVGSWNMLVYGTAFYLMEKIGEDEKLTRKPVTYFFFFLGLTNLMFNWGHHIYNLPVDHFIRHTAYVISMTELLILGRIMWNWKASLSDARRMAGNLPYRFLIASDIWIFLNLALAILMSVPAINLYTHGTHVTVAHAMGTTIGINTMILLASAFYYGMQKHREAVLSREKLIMRAYYLLNISLLVFWIALIGAGIHKAVLEVSQPDLAHGLIMGQLWPWFLAFTIAGLAIAGAVCTIAIPLITVIIRRASAKEPAHPTKIRSTEEVIGY